MKILLNTQCGGNFSLSPAGVARYNELLSAAGRDPVADMGRVCRSDPSLVQTVEELGQEANGFRSRLEVRELPDIFAESYSISAGPTERILLDPDKTLAMEILKVGNVVTMDPVVAKVKLVHLCNLYAEAVAIHQRSLQGVL
jgi:hypothetical protein